MAKNFLKVSESFVAEMTGATKITGKRKRKLNYMPVFDNIFEFLDERYEIERGVLFKNLKKAGYSFSNATIRNYYKIVKNACEFLLDKNPSKVSDFLEKHRGSLRTPYHQFVNVGVSCLIKDDILTWEEVENKMESIQEIDIISQIEGKVMTWGEMKEKLGISQLEEIDLAETKTAMVAKVEEIIIDTEEITKIFDAIELFKSALIVNIKENKTLKTVLAEKERELDFFKEENIKTTVELSGLRAENLQLSNRIKELEARIHDLNRDELTKRLLDKLDSKSATFLSAPKSTKSKQSKNGFNLPKTYSITGSGVVYTTNFLEQFNCIDRGAAKKIARKVETICKLGLDSVSGKDKKPFAKGIGKTPDNIVQVAVYKYRIILRVLDGVITLYEVFHRKNSPYAIKNN